MVKRIDQIVITAALVLGLGAAEAQQQTPAPASATHTRQIDCPTSAAAPKSPAGAVGTPQGAGQGSGLTAMPGQAEKRVEGQIKAISSTRTNRIVEIGGVKLEVEPATTVLVDCRPVTVADLKTGQRIKALYAVKDNNRNVAMVIEAQR